MSLSKRASCNKSFHVFCNRQSVDVLQQTCCYQQADIRMRLHGLRQLVNDKTVANCQQTCLLQVVSTSCNKSANGKLQQAFMILKLDDFKI